MKTHRIPLIAHVLLAGWLLVAGGCSKRASEEKAPPPKPAAGPAPATSAAPQPAKSSPVAAQPAVRPKAKLEPAPEPPPAPPVPDVLFSLRGLESGRLANDRPLFVAVRVESPVDKEAAFTLAPANGRWSDGVGVELAAAGSADKILLRAQRIDGSDGEATPTLGTDQTAEGLWRFSSAEIAKLSPGDYQVQVKLTLADGAGWHGQAAAEPVAFALTAAGATTGSQTNPVLALVEDAMLTKDWPKAAQLLDAPLAMDPDNLDLLKMRAMLCLEGGDLLGANVCVNRAWARVMREQWQHPPEDLYALSQIVSAGMSQPNAVPKDPLPAWTKLPDAVLARLPEGK